MTSETLRPISAPRRKRRQGTPSTQHTSKEARERHQTSGPRHSCRWGEKIRRPPSPGFQRADRAPKGDAPATTAATTPARNSFAKATIPTKAVAQVPHQAQETRNTK